MAESSNRQRTCIGCNKVTGAGSLCRFVLSADKLVLAKPGSPGRGAWLHRQKSCFEQAVKKRAFNRAFKTEVTDIGDFEAVFGC